MFVSCLIYAMIIIPVAFEGGVGLGRGLGRGVSSGKEALDLILRSIRVKHGGGEGAGLGRCVQLEGSPRLHPEEHQG